MKEKMKRSEVKKSDGDMKNNAKCGMQTEKCKISPYRACTLTFALCTQTLKKFDQNASQVAEGESFIYPLEQGEYIKI